MKKPLWLAVILSTVTVIMVFPGLVNAAELTVSASDINFNLAKIIQENLESTSTVMADFWSTFPTYVWVILGIIAGIIVMLVIFLLLDPKKKKGEQPARPEKKGKKVLPSESDKKLTPRVNSTPGVAPRPIPSQPLQPQEMPVQPIASQPLSSQPVQPRPVQSQADQPYRTQPQPVQPQVVQPHAIQPQPVQPQAVVRPQPIQPTRPQPAPPARPQPVKPQPIPMAQQPGIAKPGQPVVQPRFAQPQFTPPSASNLGFVVSNLSIFPNQVKEGDPVTISATVNNRGASPGQYSMVFRINNVVENIAELSLSPGASQTATYTVIKETYGEYYIDVDGLRGTLNVIQRIPASFTVSNLTVTPERIKQGQAISVGFMVTNNGEIPGIYHASVLIKGLSEATEDIPVEPGETKSVVFNIVKDTAGFFPVAVENFTGRFVVEMDWKE